MKEILRDEDLMYTLAKSESGLLVLSVVCGGIAMYTTRIELDKSEEESYNREGKSALDRLALKICKQPDLYEGRLF